MEITKKKFRPRFDDQPIPSTRQTRIEAALRQFIAENPGSRTIAL
jgi:hypothetical protein